MNHVVSQCRLPLVMAGCLLLAACGLQAPSVAPGAAAGLPSCVAVAPSEPLLGSWLAVHSRKGVAGEMRTLFSLQADGSMRYDEQLRRKGKPSQGLSETGCWQREGDTLVLRTLESNGSPVDLDDPMFLNRFRILARDGEVLRLQPAHGQVLNARRVSAGYRLPF